MVDKSTIEKNLKDFKKKVKKNFEMISLITNENLEKVKKIILKKCI